MLPLVPHYTSQKCTENGSIPSTASATTASPLVGASGHYTLDVLHQNSRGDTISAGVTGIGSGSVSEMWLHIHDETVSSVRHEDVLNAATIAVLTCPFIDAMLSHGHDDLALCFFLIVFFVVFYTHPVFFYHLQPFFCSIP